MTEEDWREKRGSQTDRSSPLTHVGGLFGRRTNSHRNWSLPSGRDIVASHHIVGDWVPAEHDLGESGLRLAGGSSEGERDG